MRNKIWLVILLAAGISVFSLAGAGVAEAQSPTSTAPQATPINVNVNNQQGIWVSGQGTVMATPDISALVLGVSVQAAKVSNAQAQAATAMSKVMAALTANGVAQKDITTQTYSIDQVTKYDNTTQTTTVIGYQVTNLVNVIVRNIDKTGAIIDAVAAAAGDLTRISSISFSVDNPAQYVSQARTLAVNDAQAKAQQLAGLAGVTLGRPTYIAENTASIPLDRGISVPLATGAPQPTTPINPGQLQVTVNVQVTYAIE